MTHPEEIVSIVPQFNLDGVTRTTGDLVFTSERVIFVKTAGKSDVAQALFGVIGALIAGASSKKVSTALQSMSLEQLLASPHEKVFFAYTELERLAVRPRRLLSSRVILRPKSGKKKKFWGKRRDLDPLVQAAGRLRTFGAPLDIA